MYRLKVGKKEATRKIWVRWVETEVTDAAVTASPVDSTTSGVLAGKVQEMGDVERSPSGVLAGRPISNT